MMQKVFQHHRLVLAGALLLAFLSAGQTQSLSADAPKITIAPTTALPNQYVAITGENFTASSAATLSSLTIGSITIDPYKINFGSPVKLDTSGRFVTNVVIPINSATLTAGSKTITATDSSNISASANVTISTPSISISPTSGRVSSTVTVTGSNYPIDSLNVGTDQVPRVNIYYYETSTSSKRVATVYPNSTGAFSTSFKVPSKAIIPSTNIVDAIISGSSIKASTKHIVTEPTISLSPSSGDPGTELTITGSDFNSFIQVRYLSIGREEIDSVTNQYTDAEGKATITATIPNLDAGTQPVTIQIGETTYTVNFTVTGTTSTVSNNQTVPDQATYSLSKQPSSTIGNLIRIFNFNNETKKWTFYDPDPKLSPYGTLFELTRGKAYWIKVKRTQFTYIAGTSRIFSEGWNLVAW